MTTYIVGQTKGGTGCLVLERQQIGDVEVYVEYCHAETARVAAQIAAALNNAEVPVAPPPLASVQPLYGGSGRTGDYEDGND